MGRTAYCDVILKQEDNPSMDLLLSGQVQYSAVKGTRNKHVCIASLYSRFLHIPAQNIHYEFVDAPKDDTSLDFAASSELGNISKVEYASVKPHKDDDVSVPNQAKETSSTSQTVSKVMIGDQL